MGEGGGRREGRVDALEGMQIILPEGKGGIEIAIILSLCVDYMIVVSTRLCWSKSLSLVCASCILISVYCHIHHPASSTRRTCGTDQRSAGLSFPHVPSLHTPLLPLLPSLLTSLLPLSPLHLCTGHTH